jgi:1-acyl-sn-glycerol-3-phosphate acyltransferase
MYYLAKKDLFDRPLKAWYLKMIHAMPLDREGDITAIKSVVKMLKSGKSLILFPEGTRSKGDKLLPAKPGAGFVVAKSGAPVLPAYIDGSYECMPADKGSANKGRSFSVYIGKPIRFDSVDANDKNAYQKISDEIMRNIAELKEKNDSSADRPSAGKHV